MRWREGEHHAGRSLHSIPLRRIGRCAARRRADRGGLARHAAAGADRQRRFDVGRVQPDAHAGAHIHGRPALALWPRRCTLYGGGVRRPRMSVLPGVLRSAQAVDRCSPRGELAVAPPAADDARAGRDCQRAPGRMRRRGWRPSRVLASSRMGLRAHARRRPGPPRGSRLSRHHAGRPAVPRQRPPRRADSRAVGERGAGGHQGHAHAAPAGPPVRQDAGAAWPGRRRCAVVGHRPAGSRRHHRDRIEGNACRVSRRHAQVAPDLQGLRRGPGRADHPVRLASLDANSRRAAVVDARSSFACCSSHAGRPRPQGLHALPQLFFGDCHATQDPCCRRRDLRGHALPRRNPHPRGCVLASIHGHLPGLRRVSRRRSDLRHLLDALRPRTRPTRPDRGRDGAGPCLRVRRRVRLELGHRRRGLPAGTDPRARFPRSPRPHRAGVGRGHPLVRTHHVERGSGRRCQSGR
uniref:Uncharacterized protein n=1 Tax=uncultured bacterium pAP3 TaxID=1781154 RepID=A0A1C9U4M4_9BACT|nr:hypothetical protein [uncultured bacterium pAP3]